MEHAERYLDRSYMNHRRHAFSGLVANVVPNATHEATPVQSIQMEHAERYRFVTYMNHRNRAFFSIAANVVPIATAGRQHPNLICPTHAYHGA